MAPARGKSCDFRESGANRSQTRYLKVQNRQSRGAADLWPSLSFLPRVANTRSRTQILNCNSPLLISNSTLDIFPEQWHRAAQFYFWVPLELPFPWWLLQHLEPAPLLGGALPPTPAHQPTPTQINNPLFIQSCPDLASRASTGTGTPGSGPALLGAAGSWGGPKQWLKHPKQRLKHPKQWLKHPWNPGSSGYVHEWARLGSASALATATKLLTVNPRSSGSSWSLGTGNPGKDVAPTTGLAQPRRQRPLGSGTVSAPCRAAGGLLHPLHPPGGRPPLPSLRVTPAAFGSTSAFGLPPAQPDFGPGTADGAR